MFLNQLSTPLQKGLFLELAILVTIATSDNDISDTFSESNLSKSDILLSKLFNSISKSEEKMLIEYQQELFSKTDDYSRSQNFLENLLGCRTRSFDAKLISNDFPTMHIQDKFDFNNIENVSNKKIFPAFGASLKQATKEILEKYSNDSNIKQELMQSLVVGGEDILNLTPEKIQSCMVLMPKIKQEILYRTLYWLVEPKRRLGLKLSETEKKIIVCELIGVGFSSGKFEEEEKNLLIVLCEILSIDVEYIEEFSDVMRKLFKVNKDLSDLINE